MTDERNQSKRRLSSLGHAVALGFGRDFPIGGPVGAVIGETVFHGHALEGGLAGLVVNGAAAVVSRRVQETERERQARELFSELFGELQSKAVRGLSYGVRGPTGWHPDHRAAGEALSNPLNLRFRDLNQVSATALPLHPDSDQLFVIGGPNATPLTALALEYEGDSRRELFRKPNALIPLRWTGISDENDPEVQEEKRVGWRLQGVGPRGTVNWGYDDAETDGRIFPKVSDRKIRLDGATAFLPETNYLIINRVPNVLHSDFMRTYNKKQSQWPYLVLFQGTHGIGTRAAELLVQPAGLETLNKLKAKAEGVPYYQALLRVSDIRKVNSVTGYFHRFRHIEMVKFFPIVAKNKTYLRAFERGQKTLQKLPDWTSVAIN
jgi:hypothetical protein